MEKFYITTTLPYVNAKMHIGHALEFVEADVIARFNRKQGKEVVFNTGTDEHGLKIYRAAQNEQKDPRQYVDEHAIHFKEVIDALNISYTNLIRTSDPTHKFAAQEFWKLCEKNGDIYKKKYKIKYCVGCELEKTDSELENDCCPIHPNLGIEIIEEENYFFRFSKYKDALLKLYREHPDFVVPEFRLKEITVFVESGLKDFSISRLKEKLPWGVSVPGDSDHVMYVWFDALINYISTLGWPHDKKNFNAYWPGFQIAGKDNLRQQSAIWQAMLFSAKLSPSAQILIHGFINAGGQKISKSAGNVINPIELVDTYGADAVRFWLLREINPFEDGDFTIEKFEERYNGDLANGVGNFASRVTTLAEKAGELKVGAKNGVLPEIKKEIQKTEEKVTFAIKEFKFHDALKAILDLIALGDKYINNERPWEGGDSGLICKYIMILDAIASSLNPFLPETSEKIARSINWKDKEKSVCHVKKIETLFPRLK